MSSDLTEKVEKAQENLEALKSYKEALEIVEDAIHEAQSEHPDIDDICLTYPCAGEVEDCIAEVEEQMTRIQDVLDMVDEL